MEQPKYKRVLLKISGEALAGDASRGLDFNVIGQVCEVIKECTQLGVQVGVVVGGGNFWRGLKDGGDRMERVRAVIFGCGTGNPFFSTDTAAVLRAAEIDADVILLAKNIDGVYSADPKVDPKAVKDDTITYDDVLAQHLQVMDSTATSLSMDNKIPVLLFALKDPQNIIRAVMGEKIGTIVKG